MVEGKKTCSAKKTIFCGSICGVALLWEGKFWWFGHSGRAGLVLSLSFIIVVFIIVTIINIIVIVLSSHYRLSSLSLSLCNYHHHPSALSLSSQLSQNERNYVAAKYLKKSDDLIPQGKIISFVETCIFSLVHHQRNLNLFNWILISIFSNKHKYIWVLWWCRQ